MTAYSIFHSMVGREITGVKIDGKSYSIDELRASLSVQPAAAVVGEGDAVRSLRRAIQLINAMRVNDPNEPISDSGHVASDLWTDEADKLDVICNQLESAPSIRAEAVVGEPVAFMTRDQMRSITARELSTIPNDKGRRDSCANIYHVPLYAAPSAPDGWQPIETAPKDGTKILAWSGFWDKHHLVRWNQGENAWCEGSWCFGSVPDMVWMPLPAPPALGGKP